MSAVLLPCCNLSPVTTPFFLSLRVLPMTADSCCVADRSPALLSNVPSIDRPPPPSLRSRLLLMTRVPVVLCSPVATLMVRLLGMMVPSPPSMPCRNPYASGVGLSAQIPHSSPDALLHHVVFAAWNARLTIGSDICFGGTSGN